MRLSPSQSTFSFCLFAVDVVVVVPHPCTMLLRSMCLFADHESEGGPVWTVDTIRMPTLNKNFRWVPSHERTTDVLEFGRQKQEREEVGEEK